MPCTSYRPHAFGAYEPTGLGRPRLGPFAAPESGAPLVVASGETDLRSGHRLVGFYRWHLSDPVVFADDLKVTVTYWGGGKGKWKPRPFLDTEQPAEQ